MDINDIKSKIFFYAREKLYNSMINACKEAINKFASDVTIHLYHALALCAIKRQQEGIRELEVLKLENDIQLAVSFALLYANKSIGTTNKEFYTKLEKEMKEQRKQAISIDFYNTAFTLLIFNKKEKALDYVEKAINLDQNNSEFLSLKAWILIKLKKSNLTKQVFEKALTLNQRNLDASLGLSEAYLIGDEYNVKEALNCANKAVVKFPSSNLALIQKIRVHFIEHNFEQALETISRINKQEDNEIILILKIHILILIVKDSNFDEASLLLNSLIEKLDKKEPRNGELFTSFVKLFSSVSLRNLLILNPCIKLMEKVVNNFPNDSNYLNELGFVYLLAGRIKEAQKCYKSATRINESSIDALMGMTLCELNINLSLNKVNAQNETINQQLEFLFELQENEELTPPLLFLMQALNSNNIGNKLDLLIKAKELQFRNVKNNNCCVQNSDDYIKCLDVDFLITLTKECLKLNVPSSSSNSRGFKQSPALKLALEVLKEIVQVCPGLYEPLFLLAKVQFLLSDFPNALECLNKILNEIDEASSEALMLMAQIQMASGLFERASQSLESALSHNFKVRENPLYHYITGLVEKRRNNNQEAIKYLNTALTLMNNQSTSKNSNLNPNSNINCELTMADKASIYLELIDCNKSINQMHEATKKLQEAIEEFHGTPEEARIMILSADYAVSKKNVQHAIEMLSKVMPEEDYYLEAKTKLAHIYLKERLDKKAYLMCYQEMVDTNPGPESFLLLGDAYMYILEPDLALECYEKALKMCPTDTKLMSKMGQALTETHHFAKAVNYYKDTIKSTNDSNLKLELADLYVKLKQYDKAEDLLASEIDSEKSKKIDDLESLKYRTKLYILLSEIYEKNNKNATAISVLREGKDNQMRVRKLSNLEQSGISEDVINTSIEILMKLSELSISNREFEQAINHYKDALFLSSNNKRILIALAKLYMQMNYLDLCQQTCTTLLNMNNNGEEDNNESEEEASVMMADIAFRKIDFDMALFHFTQLLSKQPTNWTALVRLVEIMRRTGNIESVPQYLHKAQEHESSSSSNIKAGGFHYATGLFEWYSGNLNAALRNFNLARQDTQWGQLAIYNMIEICLNPDDEMLGGEHLIDSDDSDYKDSRSMALKTAERLLKELKQKSSMNNEEKLRFRLLGNFLLLATKEKLNIEAALVDFIAIASIDIYKDNVGPILGMATAHTMLKQNQRAKNQLKRVMKNIWTFEDAEYLERCWLLLADSYIQSTKYDLANDLLRKVLQHNKASSKAYEYSGFICEKEQHYNEAAKNYEMAWKHNGRSNPAVGFKLAYNFMKCKKFAEAIEICNQVIKIHPDYPRIKKDILDKCINNLRT